MLSKIDDLESSCAAANIEVRPVSTWCVVRICQILQNAVMTDDPTLSERVTGSWVTVPVAAALREQIKRAADADHRSVASWARVALIERLANQQRAA
jgi:hypothetical protein